MPTQLVDKQRYDQEDITRGLTALAHCAGNSAAAHEQLKKQGHHIPRRTLTDWASRVHPDEYQRIRADVAPHIQSKVALEAENFVLDAAEVKQEALAHFRERLTDLKPSEASKAVHDIARAASYDANLALLYRGQPTQITEHRNVSEDLQWLSRQGVINGSAEDITDAEQVPEPLATPPQTALTRGST